MSDSEGLPIPPHLAGEFYTWLWWFTEEAGGSVDLGDPVGAIDLWVDERLAFRNPDDTKVSAVMTGENPSTTREARAALAGGKVLQEVRLGLRRDDREFFFTLRGPAMHLSGLKLPQVLSEGEEETVFDRMALYEEVTFVLAALVKRFSGVRLEGSWEGDVLPAIREWIAASP